MLARNVYEGVRLFLRPMVDADVGEEYLSWFRDHEVTRYLEARDLTREEVIDHLHFGQTSGSYEMLAICEAESSKHIGNIKLGPVIPRHRLSDLSTLIGDRAYWGMGYASEAIRLAAGIAFDELDLRKLSAGIYSSNLRAIRSFVRAGWLIEAHLLGHYESAGEFVDRVCVSCFNPRYFPKVYGGERS